MRKSAETVKQEELAALIPEFDAIKFAEDLRKVSLAAKRLLNGPIKREAILLLIANKLADRRQGTRVVDSVLKAASRLGEYIQ